MLIRPIVSCCYALVLCSTLSVASDLDLAIQKRQNVPVGTGVSASPSSQTAATSISGDSTISSDSSGSSSSLADPQSTSQSDSANSTPSISASSPSPTSFSSIPTSSSPISSSAQAAASTSSSLVDKSSSSQSRQLTSSQTPRVSSRTQQFVTTIVTVSGSSTFSHAVTSSRIEAVTASSTPTTSPGLNTSDGGSGKSGLTSGQRRTIIGVVVGIGGAILLGGLAVVAWRIWGKRKTVKNDDYDPMDPLPGSADHEKTSGGGSNDPFRTHLDQHHNTVGPVNAASNF